MIFQWNLAHPNLVCAQETDTPEEGEEYEVEEILEHREVTRIISKRKCTVDEYKVRWVGYGSDDDSWQTKEDIANCEDKLKEFEETKGLGFEVNKTAVKKAKITKKEQVRK